MKILLAGGSGFIGGHIATALQALDHEVVVASRSRGVDFNHMLSADDWLPLLEGVDTVINSVGIIVETRNQHFSIMHTRAPVALFDACAKAAVRRVIQISALGADEQASVPYHLTKKAADDALRQLPLEWFILRPSLVYGEGGKSTAMFKRLASLPIMMLPGGGKQRIQPVHVDDLVAAVIRCLDAEPACKTIDVVGPEEMTLAEWLQKLRQHKVHKAAMIIGIPMGLVKASAELMRFIIPMLHPDNLRMLQRGNTSDVQALTALLGRTPRDVP